MPQQIQRPQQEPILDVFTAPGTELLVVIVAVRSVAVDAVLSGTIRARVLLRSVRSVAGNTSTAESGGTTARRWFRLGDVHRHHLLEEGKKHERHL